MKLLSCEYCGIVVDKDKIEGIYKVDESLIKRPLCFYWSCPHCRGDNRIEEPEKLR